MNRKPFIILILILALVPAVYHRAPGAPSPDRQVKVQRAPQRAKRIEDLFTVLKQNWDSEIITGEMVDEIRKTLDYGTDDAIEPLLRRLELLAREGAAYKEDFALWWSARGRVQVGGAVLWDRRLVREAVELSLDQQEDQLDSIRQKLQQAAQSGDPVAQLWHVLSVQRRLAPADPVLRGKVEELAAAGDADANYLLGVLEQEKRTPDPANPAADKSLRSLRRAAESGYAPAMYALGERLLTKYRDNAELQREGAKWMQQAAERKLQPAIVRMAEIYSRGAGVEADAEQAESWRRRLINENPQEYNANTVKRVRTDQRTLAIALESYFVDCNTYPAHTVNAADSVHQWLAGQNPQADWSRPSFMRQPAGSRMMTLTTPVSYLISLPPDPFGVPQGRTYNYWGAQNGWIVWSPGPDGEYELTGAEYAAFLERRGDSAPGVSAGSMGASAQPLPPFSAIIIDQTYDPTNGLTSAGDIWRERQ